MNKIETSISNLKEDIRNFYNPDNHHFMVMNAVEVGEKMEIQWFFTEYEHPDNITCLYTMIDPQEEVPSIREIILSAWVAEAELVDLMNIVIEATEKGFVLEPDSESGPLLKGKN